VLPLIDRFGVIVPLTSSISWVREDARDFSTSSSSVALDELCARKVMFSTLGGFLRSFRRLFKQMHNDPMIMRSTRAPPPIAMPAIVEGFKLVASGLSRVLAAELLLEGFGGLVLWLLAAGALKTGVVAALNTGVLVVSKSGVVAVLKVVVALTIGVVD
jgi:hypothetical protein